MITVVYWLYDGTCNDPATDGYIGLSGSLFRRLRTHRKSGRFPAFRHAILFQGTRAECAAFEKWMRPSPEIGWNVIAGGFAGRVAGPSTKAKMREAAKRARTSHPLEIRYQAKLATLAKLRSIRVMHAKADARNSSWHTSSQNFKFDENH